MFSVLYWMEIKFRANFYLFIWKSRLLMSRKKVSSNQLGMQIFFRKFETIFSSIFPKKNVVWLTFSTGVSKGSSAVKALSKFETSKGWRWKLNCKDFLQWIMCWFQIYLFTSCGLKGGIICFFSIMSKFTPL